MKDWFLSLTQRERIMVQVAGSVLVVFMLYLLILEPISSNYSKNKKNVASSTQTLEWMRSAAQEVKQLRGGGEILEAPQGKQFVLSMIDRSARKAGLSAVMKRVQPEGDSGVRVWFENAAFDELIKWLAIIESKHGLSVNEINFEKTESTGLVNVRVFLES
jgi:general secretion pathway protein M